MNNEKLKKVKYNFDKITSQNSTNWKLVLFWIFFLEVVASIIEFVSEEQASQYVIEFDHNLTNEVLVGIGVTIFVWFCIYNIIFDSAKNRFRLLIFTLIASYFVVTNDFTLQFLLYNLNPLHFLELHFGVVLIIALFLKLVILYLIYQLIISMKNKKG